MRQRARTDSNHAEIVKAFRDIGASVQDLSRVGQGCPDLLVGFRGLCFLVEIKDGSKVPSRRELTVAQREWHMRWAGQVAVVDSVEQAITALVDAAKAQGRI